MTVLVMNRLVALETQQKQTQVQLAQMNAQISTVNTRLQNAEAKVNQMNSQIGQIPTINNNLTSMRTNINSLTNEINSMKTDISKLQTMKSSIDSLNTKVNTLNTNTTKSINDINFRLSKIPVSNIPTNSEKTFISFPDVKIQSVVNTTLATRKFLSQNQTTVNWLELPANLGNWTDGKIGTKLLSAGQQISTELGKIDTKIIALQNKTAGFPTIAEKIDDLKARSGMIKAKMATIREEFNYIRGDFKNIRDYSLVAGRIIGSGSMEGWINYTKTHFDGDHIQGHFDNIIKELLSMHTDMTNMETDYTNMSSQFKK